MHCELAVPGLFCAPPRARLPALELLLARARASAAEPQPLEAWLQHAFGLEPRPLLAGALTVAAAGNDPGEHCWARADPVHLSVMRDHLVVVPGAALGLAAAESEALREALNRHFAGRLALQSAGTRQWVARLEEPLALDAAPTLEAAGREPDSGVRDARAAALVNEAQMLLHDHPVNAAREARGEPPVNSLWLWGAGRAPRGAQDHWRSVSADDSSALGLARLARGLSRPLAPGFAAWLEQAGAHGRHLVVLDQLREPVAAGDAARYASRLQALEHDWFAPLLAALRAGRIGMVTLHVPDAGACDFETVRGDLRRFWRRPRALEAYA